MKFKLDENVPVPVHAARVGLGQDAHTVADEQLSGADDDAILEASIAEERVLITLDLDFSDVRAYPNPRRHIASSVGLTREALYKALRPGAQPRFETIARVCAAMGLKLTVEPAQR